MWQRRRSRLPWRSATYLLYIFICLLYIRTVIAVFVGFFFCCPCPTAGHYRCCPCRCVSLGSLNAAGSANYALQHAQENTPQFYDMSPNNCLSALVRYLFGLVPGWIPLRSFMSREITTEVSGLRSMFLTNVRKFLFADGRSNSSLFKVFCVRFRLS